MEPVTAVAISDSAIFFTHSIIQNPLRSSFITLICNLKDITSRK